MLGSPRLSSHLQGLTVSGLVAHPEKGGSETGTVSGVAQTRVEVGCVLGGVSGTANTLIRQSHMLPALAAASTPIACRM